MATLWEFSRDSLAQALLEHHQDLIDWLRANNISPDLVGAAEPITVEEIDGQKLIRYTEYWPSIPAISPWPISRVPLLVEPTFMSRPAPRPRRFELHRDRDVTGVSGPGIVADGAQFDEPFSVALPDGSTVMLSPGWCVVRWRGEHTSTVFWDRLASAEAVHGHGGATRFVWPDAPDD
jgi:hypothetical protein